MTGRPHWPQLDGVRALAIVAVVVYHLGHLGGGWIGVDIFFVLSGYLITTLLLEAGAKVGDVGTFWARRARRLLPAVLALLAVLALYAWLGGAGIVPAQLREPALATLFYTANWQQVVAGHSYFAQYTAPTALQHTWSLGVEEQYYLIWPLLLAGLLATARWRRIRDHGTALVAFTVGLASISAVWMGVAAHLLGVNRAYLGTDTRAWELLLGGAAAMLWPPGQRAGRPRAWKLLTAIGLCGLIAGTLTVSGPPGWVWDGGLVALGLCSVVMIVGGVRAPDGPVGRLLAWRPLGWIGRISYSLYLWHWPVIVLITPDTAGLTGSELLITRLVAMTVVSVASYRIIESPLRRYDWAALRHRLHLPAGSFVSVGVIATAAVIVSGTIGPPIARSAPIGALPEPQELPPGSFRLPPASPRHPYRVWILGDSVMFDASLGLTAALQATGQATVVANTSFPGWGLTTDHSWPSEARTVLASAHPQIAMGTWSWDDEAAVVDPSGYQQRLQAALRLLLSPEGGVQLVILFQFPRTGPSTAITDPVARTAEWSQRTEAQQVWDEAAQVATAAFPGRAVFVTTDQLFAPRGRYHAWLRTGDGRWLRARKVDNAHMCPFGAAEFGAFVVGDLAGPLHLAKPGAGWETGRWTRDARYNDPKGSCPDDRPPTGYRGIALPG